jgi:hypothetical protein
MSWLPAKRNLFGWIRGREEIHSNPLVDLMTNEPMARREFLDQYERLPLWARPAEQASPWSATPRSHTTTVLVF